MKNSVLFHEYLPYLSFEDGHITDTESRGFPLNVSSHLDVNETPISSGDSNLFGL